MGMYDYLNNEQVKCFYVPIFYKSFVEEDLKIGGLSHSGGHLFVYKNGDILPLKTEYYKYPQNFLILDSRTEDMYYCPKCKTASFGKSCDSCGRRLSDEDEVICIAHIIKNGKLYDTVYSINDIPDSFMSECELIIDYYGVPVFGVNTKDDILGYINNLKEYRKGYLEIIEKYSPASRALFAEFSAQRDGAKPKDEKKLEELQKVFDEQKELEDKEISEYKKKFADKYCDDGSYEKTYCLMDFGEYIYCYEHYLKRNDDAKEEQFPKLIEEFKMFLSKYPNIMEDFFVWNETSSERQEEIRNIVNNINKGSV